MMKKSFSSLLKDWLKILGNSKEKVLGSLKSDNIIGKGPTKFFFAWFFMKNLGRSFSINGYIPESTEILTHSKLLMWLILDFLAKNWICMGIFSNAYKKNLLVRAVWG